VLRCLVVSFDCSVYYAVCIDIPGCSVELRVVLGLVGGSNAVQGCGRFTQEYIDALKVCAF
jgi:hypothetical protein